MSLAGIKHDKMIRVAANLALSQTLHLSLISNEEAFMSAIPPLQLHLTPSFQLPPYDRPPSLMCPDLPFRLRALLGRVVQGSLFCHLCSKRLRQ